MGEKGAEPTQKNIQRIQDLFGLQVEDVAHIFNVSCGAIDTWISEDAIPAAYRAKCDDLQAIGELLNMKLRRGLLPAVARRPAAAYGGLTMLEMVQNDRHRELRVMLENSFDWSLGL